MAQFSLSLGGTVPVICWMQPAANGAFEIFCNAPRGYTVTARRDDGTGHVVLEGTGPVHDTVTLALSDTDTALTIQAR